MIYRTIEEANALKLPLFPSELLFELQAFAQDVINENCSTSSKVRKIYAVLDKLTAYIQPLAVCSKGCSACCKIDVKILSIEASYIAKNTKAPLALPRSRQKNFTAIPCTFLKSDGTCGIYEYRPFVCRTYFTLDNPSFCEDPMSTHVRYTPDSNEWIGDIWKLLMLLNGLAKEPSDIREFFPQGLPSSQSKFHK